MIGLILFDYDDDSQRRNNSQGPDEIMVDRVGQQLLKPFGL